MSVSIALRIAKPPLPSPFNFLPSLTAFAHLPCPPFRRSTPEALDELNRSVEALRASPIDEDPGMAAMLRSVVLRVPDVESIAPDGRRCNLLAPDWEKYYYLRGWTSQHVLLRPFPGRVSHRGRVRS